MTPKRKKTQMHKLYCICQLLLENLDELKPTSGKMVTFKNERISLKQLIEHPWLQNIGELTKYNKVNKKNRYIG